MPPLQSVRTAAATLALLAGLAALLGFAFVADVAAQGRISWNATGGIAVKGYDAVSYFSSEEPLVGDERYSYTWSGVTWHFSSGENLALFVAHPENYAPQYGGYAAFAMTLGGAKDIDPLSYVIEDEKLYLFGTANRYATWRRRKERNIARADANWERVQQVLAVRSGNTIRRCSEAYKQRRFHDAQDLCLPSAEDGDREFQAMLGISFADAPVQYRNFEQAVFWLVKAAGQGQRDAQFRLAGLYSRGRGISRDYEEALFWYEEAAINGHIRSRVRLAEMYRDGFGHTRRSRARLSMVQSGVHRFGGGP